MTDVPARLSPRARARQQTLADITRIGREHLVRDGAAQLSLRAVARDLGVVSSAVYRYVADRDALLTLLVVDAYDELGREVEEAVDGAGPDHRDAFLALGRAVRAWSRREPARHALLFGTPVPGYAAPPEATVDPGTRVVLALVRVVVAAHEAGALEPHPGTVTPALRDDVDRIRARYDLDVPAELVARTLLVWPALFGVVAWEVFGQYGDETVTDHDALFEHHLAVLARTVGFN